MRIIKVSGDHYAIGRHIGLMSRRAFLERIRPSNDFQRLLPWRDSGWLDEVEALTRVRLPTVHRELLGLADGCEQEFRDILLWNCRGDIMPTGPEGCSSVAVRRRRDVLLTHNEDGDPALRDDCFVLDATLSTALHLEGMRFVCFVYPGSIPGHTLAATSKGLAYTVNNLRVIERASGVPRMLMARALLEAGSASEFTDLLKGTARTGGFHFMVADCEKLQPYSVEAPLHGVSAIPVNGVAVHANHMIASDFLGMPQVITRSSHDRQSRLEQLARSLPPEPHEEDLLSILGDQEYGALPIYRNSTDDPDRENTLATATFRLTPEGVDAIIRDAPAGEVVHVAFFPRYGR